MAAANVTRLTCPLSLHAEIFNDNAKKKVID